MKSKLFFFGFGSICHYQHPALRAINNQIPVDGVFYQTRKKIMPEDFVKPGECFLKIYCFGTDRIFRKIPRSLFRLLENTYIIFSGLWQTLKTDAGCDVFVTGYLFFLWLPILKLRFRRVIVWKFGIAEEFLLRGKSIDKIKFLFIKGIEKLFLPMADAFVVQSAGMTEYVQKNFKAFSKPIYKIPCCVDYDLFHFDETGRQEMRKKLGLVGHFVVTHIGSGSAWRANDDIVKVFKAIRSNRENAFLLIVSRDPVFKQLVSRNKIEDVMIIGLPHHVVPQALWASDLALLINISDPITNVMSPIKYPEYLAAGLPVILSGTQEYSNLTEEERIGVVLDMDSMEWKNQLLAFLDYLDENREEIRKRATATAHQSLSWHCMHEVIDRAFKTNRFR